MKVLFVVTLSILAMMQTGCLSGYRLGSTLPPDIQSVYIPLARNESSEPLLEKEVTQATLAQMQRDGSLSIELENNADAVLYITVTDFELRPLAYGDNDNLRPDEYRLILKARVELIQQSNGRVLARTSGLEGRAVFELTRDLVSDQRTAIPEAAEDLGRRIVAAVTEAWPD